VIAVALGTAGDFRPCRSKLLQASPSLPGAARLAIEWLEGVSRYDAILVRAPDQPSKKRQTRHPFASIIRQPPATLSSDRHSPLQDLALRDRVLVRSGLDRRRPKGIPPSESDSAVVWLLHGESCRRGDVPRVTHPPQKKLNCCPVHTFSQRTGIRLLL
jgi:hypothetical protein